MNLLPNFVIVIIVEIDGDSVNNLKIKFLLNLMPMMYPISQLMRTIDRLRSRVKSSSVNVVSNTHKYNVQFFMPFLDPSSLKANIEGGNTLIISGLACNIRDCSPEPFTKHIEFKDRISSIKNYTYTNGVVYVQVAKYHWKDLFDFDPEQLDWRSFVSDWDWSNLDDSD